MLDNQRSIKKYYFFYFCIEITVIFVQAIMLNNLKLAKMNLLIEKQNKAINKVKLSIQRIAKTAKTKQEAVNRLSDILPSDIKIGFGGSHVWVANKNNERILIITE